MIEAERKSLEETVHTFAARLDERREIIVHSFEYYQSVDAVSWRKTQQLASFPGPPLCNVEKCSYYC